MNNLFNQSDVSTILKRIDKLNSDSQKQWGKMNPSQMLAHCNVSMETAMGDKVIERVFLGRIIGALMKSSVLSEKPFAKGSPTDRSYIFNDNRNFDEEKLRLKTLINKFHEGGGAKCTKHPHPFFGTFTPEQWAVFQWKHLDHHLRQFGV